MSNQELLIASDKGELEKVQQILINKRVNINCQNILSLKKSFNLKHPFFNDIQN